jgi:hypothetical protein
LSKGKAATEGSFGRTDISQVRYVKKAMKKVLEAV